jgi:putative transcriptional regulator
MDGKSVAISPAKEMLNDLAAGRAPPETLVALGYAGWSAGQLEEEIKSNCWLTAPSSVEIIFHIPFEKRWQAAAASIGVDLNRISYGTGHA